MLMFARLGLNSETNNGMRCVTVCRQSQIIIMGTFILLRAMRGTSEVLEQTRYMPRGDTGTGYETP